MLAKRKCPTTKAGEVVLDSILDRHAPAIIVHHARAFVGRNQVVSHLTRIAILLEHLRESRTARIDAVEKAPAFPRRALVPRSLSPAQRACSLPRSVSGMSALPVCCPADAPRRLCMPDQKDLDGVAH